MPSLRRALFVATALLTLRALAADYYVNDASTTGDVALPGCPSSASGTDTATCGTCAAPCRTLQYAYDHLALQGGDTVHVNTGVYSVSAATPILALGNAAKAGSAGKPLSFVGPVGANGRAARSSTGTPLALLNGNNVATSGVLITVPGIRLEGLGITNINSDTCSTPTAQCGSGVRIPDGVTANWFEFVGLEVYGLHETLSDAVDIDQTKLTCSATCRIDNNLFHDSPSSSAAIFLSGLTGVEISNNEINGWSNASSPVQDAIQIYGAVAPGVVVRNNLITGNAAGAVLFDECISGTSCVGWIPQNCQISSNTFRQNGSESALRELHLSNGTGFVVTNNIIEPGPNEKAMQVEVDAAVTRSDYNGFSLGQANTGVASFHGTSYFTLANWQAQGFDAHSVSAANAGFVSSTDFHLTSPAGHHDGFGKLSGDSVLSPFVDRGDPASDFSTEPAPNGGRIDLGAYGNTVQSSLTPISLATVSGSGQRGPWGTALPLPLVAKASYTSSGTPAPGVRIDFQACLGGGSLLPTSVATDSQGEASTVATLGLPGDQVFIAEAREVLDAGSASFTAEASDAGNGPVDTGGDGGSAETGGSRSHLLVGCGCGASGGSGMGFLMGLVLLALRRQSPLKPK